MLRAMARNAARNGSGAGGGTLRLIRCDVGRESYCLSMDWVRSIQRQDLLERNRSYGGPLGWLPGFGTRIPVWSLPARLGSALAPQQPTGPIVVLDAEPEPWGLAVDRVSRATPPATDRLALPQVAQDPQGRFRSVVRLDGSLALELDPDHLVPGSRTGPEEAAAEEAASEDAVAAEEEGAAATGHRERSPQPTGGSARAGSLMLFSTAPRSGTGAPDLLFGLSLLQVREISLPLPLTPVPSSPDFLLGLAPWRDGVVPVVDLSLRLGSGPSFFEGGSRFLVVRGARNPARLAFPIRPDVRSVALPLEGRPVEGEPAVARHLVRGMFETSLGTVVVPDVDRILAGGAV